MGAHKTLCDVNLKASPMPPAPFTLDCYFLFGFQSDMLKVVLVRWCPHSVSMAHFSQFAVIWDAHVVSFVVQNVSFGMLVASILAPRGTIDRFRGTWEHKKGDLEVPGLDFCRFWGDFGTAIWDLFAKLATKTVFASHLVWDVGCVAKTNFSCMLAFC